MSRELIEFSEKIDEQFDREDLQAVEAFWVLILSWFD